MPVMFDETLWRALYRSSQGKLEGVELPALTYQRAWRDRMAADNMFSTRRDWLTGFGLDNNAKILVVGCAYGYLIEYLIDAGITDVWGIDPSPWIWDAANDSEWRPDVKPRVANDWIGSGTEQASLDALPGVPSNERFGWIVDEDAAPAHSDAEIPGFIAALEDRLQGNAKSRIVHIVTTGGRDSSQNWKTLAEWAAFAPDHTWVDAVTGSIA